MDNDAYAAYQRQEIAAQRREDRENQPMIYDRFAGREVPLGLTTYGLAEFHRKADEIKEY
jgi:hypothetical protein